ncbi:HAMP domain-containing sensor histidine kinase [Paenibacillus aurantius]|uniref:histidine kinase n=1 Tax=Paenibacillus aurantius TaxID=2918900 RepID=A0AA96LDQ9_9BACL|nr:HAMP domain-containing sensor histidine kinase [Paenibacillus aurantius]WNQ09797.1 HAMP domain-containing sensor histidine kinase [Paenibacillus aurantius]
MRRGLRPYGRLPLPRSLRVQLLSRSLFILAAILLLIGLFQYYFMQRFLYGSEAESSLNQIRSTPNDFWQRGRGGPRAPEGPGFGNQDFTFAVISPDGTFADMTSELSSSGAAPELAPEAYTEAYRGERREANYTIAKNEQGVEQLVVLQLVGGRGHPQGLVQLGTPTGPLKKVLMTQMMTFLILSALALILAFLTFLPVIRRTLTPLFRMVQTVEQIDSGKLDVRLPVQQGQQEIDRLAASFNGMLERLEQSFESEREAKEQMRRFLADASHELRTPLTSIHGFLEVLLRGAAQNPDQLNRALKSMHVESERINKLVADLLMLARLDRSPEIRPEEEDLDAILAEMEPQLRLLAGDRQVVLSSAPGTVIRLDKDKIKQVILNLYHNAVQHTDPAEGQITVSVRPRPDEVVIEIADNGTGIPEEHLPHLFERFYRMDTSRTRKNGGAGLGLSISQSLVELHGGSIEVDSTPGQGSRFRVTLPRLAQAADPRED